VGREPVSDSSPVTGRDPAAGDAPDEPTVLAAVPLTWENGMVA
jgi:hypothetical protein